MAKNVYGNPLITCSLSPLTGFFRKGKCDTCKEDAGMHTVCALMTDDFLRFSFEKGNDLSTPRPEYNFPGLKEGICFVCLDGFSISCKAPRIKDDSRICSEFVELSVLLFETI